ncbi:MAG TPA: DoxX family protein [Lacipirellulaceae bacterium]|jgi:putative oxidoreductase|nr:DoxX family protein [Lacipirellulaceae bacterium]
MENDRVLPVDRAMVNLSLLILRVAVGVIFAAHGAQKLFGAFDGMGLEKTVGMLGTPLGYLVPVGEFFGGIGLVIGFLTRFSAAALVVIMIGAIVKVHAANGFFLDKHGFEYNIALIGLLLPIFLCGPGTISVGRLFMPRSAKTGRPVVVLE